MLNMPRANWVMTRFGGASLRRRIRAISPATPGRLRGSGFRSAAVSVSSTPCSAGKRPVNSVERLGEHIAVLQKPFVKLSPVRASSAQLGISASTHPGSSGQCRGCRC
jgi:hypothetical protein